MQGHESANNETRSGGQCPKCSIAIAPEEVGAIIHKVYGETYDGNVRNQEETVEKYFEEYDAFIHDAKEATTENMTCEDLKITMNGAKESAAGMLNRIRLIPKCCPMKLAR